MKKKVLFLFSLGLIAGIGFPENVNAANYQEPSFVETTESERDPLGGIDDSEKVAILPDGGIVYGEVEISNLTNPDEVIVIDSDIFPDSITAGECRDLIEEGMDTPPLPVLPSALARGTSVATHKYKVYYGSYFAYASNTFSGSGWRFAGHLFYPEDYTGDYLLWETFGDSALIATQAQAQQKTGSALYPGQKNITLVLVS